MFAFIQSSNSEKDSAVLGGGDYVGDNQITSIMTY